MLTAFVIIFILLSLFYFFLVISYLKGWLRTPEEFVDHNFQDVLAVSILVPARNEAKNIANCLNSLQKQNYQPDLVEIIVLDDFSEDETPNIVSSYEDVKLICLHEHLDPTFKNLANKKRALAIGISKATNNIIITIDADCIYSENWLKALTQYYIKRKPKLLTAPVTFFKGKGIFAQFLALDLISLMGITASSIKNGNPSTVNGANLLFSKNIFEEVKGFEGNENIASGDDVFLMQKINKKYPGQIASLKNYAAIAETAAPQKFMEFVHQRIRWTSKSSRYADKNVVLTLSLNYLYYLCILIGIILSIFIPKFLIFLIPSYLIKLIIDAIYFSNLLQFFKRKELINYFLFVEFLHIFYINILGILSLIGKYTWKGRKV